MKAKLRRNQILDCAKKVFSEKGYYETYVEDIIKLAKIGKGTIYEYFTGKEDLFISLLNRSLEEWKEAVKITRDVIKNLDPITYFKLRIKKTFEFLNSDREITTILLRTGFGFNPQISKMINEFEKNLRKNIMYDLKLAKHLGVLNNNVDFDILTGLLIGGVTMIAYKVILNSDHLSDEEIDILTDKYITPFVDGFLKKENINNHNQKMAK